MSTMVVLVVTVSGCSARWSRFQVVDYRDTGAPERYQETFKEAYYSIGGDGNVELVLRRSQPSESDPDVDITQLIYIRTVWKSIPGKTVADSTQINGVICYVIAGGGVGATFEGAGSVFFKENRRGDRLSGTLEQALLRPTRRLAGSHSLFNRAQLQGKFHAKRDRRRVVRLVHEMNRLFGPPPPYDAVASR